MFSNLSGGKRKKERKQYSEHDQNAQKVQI